MVNLNLSDATEYTDGVSECHTRRVPVGNLFEQLQSIKPEGLTMNAWASRAGVSRSWFFDVRKGAVPKTDTLEKVVGAAGFTLAQFYDLPGVVDAAPIDEPGTYKKQLPFTGPSETLTIPLLGTAQGSDLEIAEDGTVSFIERMDLDTSNVVEYLRRPEALLGRDDVYAITVVGDSVSPRYEDGDPAYVSSKQRARNGDYVVVQMKRLEGDEERLHIALLKVLVRRTSTHLHLCQKTPEVEFAVPIAEIHAVHRVIPWREIVFF